MALPFLSSGAISDFPTHNNNSTLFKFKTKIAGRTRNDCTKNVEIRAPLKYLSNFWKTLEMPQLTVELILF